MYIKYHGFKCECGETVSPPFNELHFDMREGEILENGSGELICEKCGATYELEDMEFTPIFVRTDKKDENGLCFIRIRSNINGDGEVLGKAGGRAMQIILNHMTQQYSEVIDLYTKARAAKIKFWHNTNDRFTDDERDSLIMLASAFSAILRRTYRIFVTEQGLEPTAFWDAYIRFAVFRQNVLFNKDWKKVFKLDKELHRLVKKTSNPRFVEKIFTGDISLKWLTKELVRQMKRKRDDTGRGGQNEIHTDTKNQY